jgi:hypothetical protein
MAGLLQQHYFDLAVSLGVLLLVAGAGAYLLRRFRDRAGEDGTPRCDLLTKFGEMRSRGDLSDMEYRTIKTVLAASFQNELNGDDEKG